MKVLYLINNVNIGGATDVLIYFVQNSINDSKKIICKNNYLHDNHLQGIEIIQGSGKLVYDTFIDESYDLIHWFRAESSLLFEELCSEMKLRNKIIPIITSVCQYPREFKLRLTPNEIIYNQYIVFNDNHAYSCKLNNSIPSKRKKMIYLGIYYDQEQYAKIESTLFVKKDNSEIFFGRGSSLNKCPKDMIAWYNEINVPQKKFTIVGIGNNAVWLKKEILKYKLENNIQIIPHLDYEEWLKMVSGFDIFLYQIPSNAYSSVDGTMQAAMLYGKPIVYYGSEPPKALIVHGETGFIANCKSEFVHYATLLANDSDLRLRMGKKAKERMMTEFHWKVTIKNYQDLYQKIILSRPIKNKLACQYKFSYTTAQIIFFLRSNFVNLFPKHARKELKRWVLGFFKT